MKQRFNFKLDIQLPWKKSLDNNMKTVIRINKDGRLVFLGCAGKDDACTEQLKDDACAERL